MEKIIEEQLLSQIGLSRGEINVYLALIRLGETTISPIVSESKVTKSKVYDILERLIDKGLVGYLIKDRIKHFTANNPKMILEYTDKKLDEINKTKQQLSKLVDELVIQRNSSTQNRIAEVYYGFHGLKSIREELRDSMNAGETMLILGAPKIANDKWENWLLDFHKQSIRKKISVKMIYNSDVREYGVIRKKWKITKIKYLAENLVSPNWIDIFTDAILFVIVLKEPIAFVVRDKELANRFKIYFDIMWKESVE
jgi:sugar-specific transcriptional regulator TrmB